MFQDPFALRIHGLVVAKEACGTQWKLRAMLCRVTKQMGHSGEF